MPLHVRPKDDASSDLGINASSAKRRKHTHTYTNHDRDESYFISQSQSFPGGSRRHDEPTLAHSSPSISLPHPKPSSRSRSVSVNRLPLGSRQKATSRSITTQVHRPHKEDQIQTNGDATTTMPRSSAQQLPKARDYPSITPQLFEYETTSVSVLKNRLVNNLGLQCQEKYTKARRNGQGLWRCTIQAEVSQGNFVKAIGDDVQRVLNHLFHPPPSDLAVWPSILFTYADHPKRAARIAANSNLVAKLHEANLLAYLFPTANDPSLNLSRREIAEAGKDSLEDVYNFAAARGMMPAITMGDRLPRKHFSVNIRLADADIAVQGKASNATEALAAACRSFKTTIEARYLKGDRRIGEQVQSDISTANTKEYMKYYKLCHPRANIIVRLDEASDAMSLHEGVISIDGSLLAQRVIAPNKKLAETFANLAASVELIKREPKSLDGWRQAAKSASGTVLGPVPPIDTTLDSEMVSSMEETLRGLETQKKLRDEDEDTDDPEDPEHDRKMAPRPVLPDEEVRSRSTWHKRRMDSFRNRPGAAAALEARQKLPMSEYKDRVLDHVHSHAYSIVVGATGSGKTTQVPQIILDDAVENLEGGGCNVLCTQPRRIAATSVARRVADERAERLQDTVGYQVRFDTRLPEPGGSITYCTTGVLLNQLQRRPDNVFDTISHIVIDEVHERDIQIDFLLNILRRTATARRRAGQRVPKIILMSATIDPKLFARYFEEKLPSGEILDCPSLSVPGRTFPVEEKYYDTIMDEIQRAHGASATFDLRLEKDTSEYMDSETKFKMQSEEESSRPSIDWRSQAGVSDEQATQMQDALVPKKLISTTVAHLAKTTAAGAILVFLPGYDEIKKVREQLEVEKPLGVDFTDPYRFRVSALHSSVPGDEQAAVFDSVPEGCRKIILSTNIAETSVTIPDVQYVVDSGKLREKRYDQLRRITKLQCTWISKSNARQRAGRAGRVQNGNYYALYTKARSDSLQAIGLPEMLRSDLQEICLDVKSLDFGVPIEDFLTSSIEPPSPDAINMSTEALKSLQALTDSEELTALGKLLSELPVHPTLGKMIVYGVIFRCLDPMIILGAALNERSPFVSPPEKRQEAQAAQEPFVEESQSDHIALINAIRHTRLIETTKGYAAARYFCTQKFIHHGAYTTIKNTCDQIEDVLVDAGLIPRTYHSDRYAAEIGHPSLNKTVLNDNVIVALTMAGLHPNVGIWQSNTLRTLAESHAIIHPSSVNFKGYNNPRKGEMAERGTLCTYSTMQMSNDGRSIFLRDTSICSSLMAILFCGRYSTQGRTIAMDGWLPFFLRTDRKAAETLLDFRDALDDTLSWGFRLLSKLKAQRFQRQESQAMLDRGQRAERKYLADDPSVETFAKGLVELLELDASMDERRKKGRGV